MQKRHLSWLIFIVLALAASGCAGEDPNPTNAAVPAASSPSPAPSAAVVAPTLEPETAPEPAQETANGGADIDPETPACANVADASRVDVNPNGNRLADMILDIANAQWLSVDLGSAPEWVVATGQGAWHVALEDGTAVVVNADGSVESTARVEGPPVTGPGGIESAYVDHALFVDPLPDTRVVYSGELAVALTQPTDRYPHGVLGDRIEAGAIEIVDRCNGNSTIITIPAPDAIEGISAMLADIDGDLQDEVLATVSNRDGGARLVAWETNGVFLAESAPIGRGNRWRNQLAIGPFGPEGQIEIIDVRTPHIGGVVEYFRLQGSELVRVAATDGSYTTHSIGSRNLDLGIAFDANADGSLDVVVPQNNRRALVVLSRLGDRITAGEPLALPAPLTSNLAVGDSLDSLAFGTEDGQLHVLMS